MTDTKYPTTSTARHARHARPPEAYRPPAPSRSEPRHALTDHLDTVVLPPLPRVPPVAALVESLGVGVVAWLAPVEVEICEWCTHGHLTTVQVYGDPEPDPLIVNPIDIAGCCRCCAPAVIRLARSQQSEGCDRDIRVELTSPPAGAP
jgi:hypothetical protein